MITKQYRTTIRRKSNPPDCRSLAQAVALVGAIIPADRQINWELRRSGWHRTGQRFSPRSPGALQSRTTAVGLTRHGHSNAINACPSNQVFIPAGTYQVNSG
jgi:hypothetical protein